MQVGVVRVTWEYFPAFGLHYLGSIFYFINKLFVGQKGERKRRERETEREGEKREG